MLPTMMTATKKSNQITHRQQHVVFSKVVSNSPLSIYTDPRTLNKEQKQE